MVETTAVFLPAEPNFLIVGHDVLPVGMAERRVVDHDVVRRDALRLQVGLEDLVGGARIDVVGAGQHPALHLARRSSGNRPPGSPAGSAPRRCRTRCGCTPGPRTAPGRTGCRSAPRTPAAPTCATPRSSSRTPRRTCPTDISSRAFSANSGQLEAGSTTTGFELACRAGRPWRSARSISISMTSFSVVSLIAMVPESECRMPTLIGPFPCRRPPGSARPPPRRRGADGRRRQRRQPDTPHSAPREPVFSRCHQTSPC